jgi:mycothiol synthase
LAENVPDASDIPNFLFRRFRDERDFGSIANVINASWEADLIDARTSGEDLARTWKHTQNFDPMKDAVLVERDDTVIGYASVTWRHKANNLRVYTHNCFLLPEWRKDELRSAMVRLNEHRLRKIAAGHRDSSLKFLEVYANSRPNHWKSVLEAEGYRPSWFLFGMVRSNLQDVPDLPLPEGIEVRPVKQQDLREIWDSAREAFRDGREFTEEQWSEQEYNRRYEAATFMPGLWQIAWEGDEVVGGVHNYIDKEENEAFNRKWGHTEQVFVRRHWRKRGIAMALIARSLKILGEHGMTEATLDVDTENPSGALGLYESLGYRPYSEFIFYRKPVF